MGRSKMEPRLGPGKQGTQALAQLVRSRRVGLGLTQEELAKEISVSRSMINEIERGASPITHEETARDLAKVLGVSADEIFACSGVVPPDIIRALRGLSAEEFSAIRQRLALA